MKKSGRTKWLVIVGALVIFFSVGAVAWAATDEGNTQGSAVGRSMGPGGLAMMFGEDDQDEAAAGCEERRQTFEERRQAFEERREQRRERLEALLDGLRDDMSPQDQATYDRLKKEIEEKRAALEAARQDLAAAVKELRELTDRYLDLED